jgi:tetratricopeptide (TPR) repeat protein
MLDQYTKATWFNVGARLCEQGRYQQAVPYLEHALKLNAKDAQAFYDLGLCRTAMKQYKQAIVAFDSAVKVNPHYVDALANRGSCKDLTGDRAGAVRDYNQAIALSKSPPPDLYYDRGSEYYLLGEYAKAIPDLTEALKLDAKSNDALLYRALAYGELKQPERAIGDLNEYIRVTGGDQDSYLARGNANYALSRFSSAVNDYSSALRCNHDLYQAMEKRALAYVRIGQSGEGLKDANELIKEQKYRARGYGVRAFAQLAMGEWSGARGDCDACRELNVDDYLEHFVRAMVDLHKNLTDDAMTELNRSIELNSLFDEAYFARGTISCSLKEYKKAADDFSKALHYGPETAAIHNNLGYAYMKADSFDSALTEFDSALKLDPKFAEALSNRGFTRLQLGQIEDAIKDCRHAITLKESMAQGHLHLAMALEKAGETQEAAQEYGAANKLDPSLIQVSASR